MLHFKKYIVLSIPTSGRYLDYKMLSIKIKTGIDSKSLGLQIENNKWVPAENDRLYFFPGCSVPRFKVRDKFNTTIKPEYATAAFISTQDLKASDNMFDVFNNLRPIEGRYITNWFDRIYGPDHNLTVKLKSLLLNCENDILIPEDDWYRIKYKHPDDAPYGICLYEWRRQQYNDAEQMSDAKSNLNLYSTVINSQFAKLTCPIYMQDQILPLLNEDQMIIDEKKYQELRNMANSSDKENIILVMELMSNANFEKSFVYLLFLLKEFNSKITSQKKEIGHVNFKSLLIAMDLTEKSISNMCLESMMKQLKKQKQFTRSNVQRLTQFFLHEPKHKTETTHFVSGPVLRPDAESTLDDEFEIQDEDEIQIVESDDDNDNFNL